MRLPILKYHKVDRIPPAARYLRNYVLPEQFAAQLAALERWGYETISFTDWLAYRNGTTALPRRPIILTFDDGYRSTYEIAWTLLQRCSSSPTSSVRRTNGTETRFRSRCSAPPRSPRCGPAVLRSNRTARRTQRSPRSLPTARSRSSAPRATPSRACSALRCGCCAI